MTKYLLDTSICIFFLRGKHGIDLKIREAGVENCFISEITLAELIFGAENSSNPEKHLKAVNDFREYLVILPVINSLESYGKEKAKLRKSGKTIDEFDLLIGATAVTNGLVMVTSNVRHFQNWEGLPIEDWTKENDISHHFE
ncbi:MAG: type II toxin-antitoxin system VapC family toxin [Bacteroidia bacterium]|nr:type II toxin-antitoxin system VapC family toxin [Bacteroidia bacterium]